MAECGIPLWSVGWGGGSWTGTQSPNSALLSKKCLRDVKIRQQRAEFKMFSLLELFGSKNAAELVTSIKELHYPPLILTVFNFVPLAAAVSHFTRHFHTSISFKGGLESSLKRSKSQISLTCQREKDAGVSQYITLKPVTL